MEKVNMNYQIDNIDEIISNIKSSKVISKLLKELEISDEEISDNYELLNNYIKINSSCLNCKSMKNCNHSTLGHYYGLKRDEQNQLTDYFAICKYFKEYYIRKKNLLFTTFDEQEILDENQKNFIIDNANYLGKDLLLKIISLQNNKEVSGHFLQLADSKLRLKLIKSLSYSLLLNHKLSVVKFNDLLKAIKAEFKAEDKNATLNEVMNSEILILDGIGNESITSWSRDEVLLSLLDNRIQMEKTTFICSEFSLEQLRKLYKISYNDDVKAEQIIEKIKVLKR